MLLLGVGIAYSKRTSADYLFKRGIITLILTYTLGLCRDAIPAYINYLIHGDMETLKDGVLDFSYQQQYYHQDLLRNIIITIFSLFWISLLYFAILPFKNVSVK